MFRQAVSQVEERLSEPIWSLPTTVISGPTTLWPGLKVSSSELTQVLQSAGYSRSPTPRKPGTYSLKNNRFEIYGLTNELGHFNRQKASFRVHNGTVTDLKGPNPLLLPSTSLAIIATSDNPSSDRELRTPRPLDDFPEHLIQAVLAMEDSKFWSHDGVSYTGILRAFYANVRGGRQGGSTITQQLAKNLFLSPERSFERKFNELFYALALEEKLSKKEILAMYLNEIYWGQANGIAICGADSAAKTYFGKPVEKLSLSESATLAGIISAPNTYSPIRSPERAKARRDLALFRMEKEGHISSKQAQAAKKSPLNVVGPKTTSKAPYAVNTALERTEQRLGEGVFTRSGLRIQTTLHPLLQARAEEAVAKGLGEIRKKVPDAQMALVALNPQNGRILAMVGGSNYRESSFNRALLAKRQLGSTIKPLTLAAIFDKEAELSPATLIEDKPIQREGNDGVWTPTNYDGDFQGLMTIRTAVSKSRNIPAVLMAERLGYAQLDAFFDEVGLSDAKSLPSTALGAFDASPLELALAYSLFVNGGALPKAHLIDQIYQSTNTPTATNPNPDWKLAVEQTPESQQVISPRAAALARSVLETVLISGSGRQSQQYAIGPGAGGKTGTTNEARDAWFVGVSPTLSVAVWAGRDSGAPLGLSGSSAALPTWSRFMKMSGTTEQTFRDPPTVTWAETCIGDWKLGQCNQCGLELYSSRHAPRSGCSVMGYFWDLKRRWEPILDDAPSAEMSNMLPN